VVADEYETDVAGAATYEEVGEEKRLGQIHLFDADVVGPSEYDSDVDSTDQDEDVFDAGVVMSGSVPG
jgi:hypothetical protein